MNANDAEICSVGNLDADFQLIRAFSEVEKAFFYFKCQIYNI